MSDGVIATPPSAAARGLPLGVGAAAFALFAVTAARTVPLGDSGELIAAAAARGIAHPPGYPLYVLLGHGALMFPLGEPALRMNLLSGLFGAICCGLVTWMVQRWTGKFVAATAAGLTLAVSSTFWGVSIVAEVYTLHLALVALLLASAVATREGSNRGAVVMALALGCGVAHRPTVLLALPAALVLAGPAWRRLSWLRRAGLAALAGGIPVGLYTWMLLRSAVGPVANWGRPDHWAGLVSHVGTRAYRYYWVGPDGWFDAAGWRIFGDTVLVGFAWLALPLAVLGLLAARRTPATRAPAVALALLFVVQTLFALSYATQDSEVLFLPAHLAVALGAGLGLAALGRASRPSAALLAAVCVLAPILLNLPRHNLARYTVGADFGADMLASVPPDGVLFVDGDNAFVLAYLLQVRGERPDVTVYDRNGQLFQDELREEGAAPLGGESRAAWRIRREQAFAMRSRRPVLFMTWPGYELPRGWRFDPEGLFYRVRPPGAPGAGAAALATLWASFHEERITRQALRVDDPFALTVAATYPLMRGERARVERRIPEMGVAFAAASRLARTSESIHNYLGTVYGRGGNLAQAILEFEQALAIKPVSVRAWNNLAFAKSLAGDRDGAEVAWRRSLELDPNQPDVQRRVR